MKTIPLYKKISGWLRLALFAAITPAFVPTAGAGTTSFSYQDEDADTVTVTVKTPSDAEPVVEKTMQGGTLALLDLRSETCEGANVSVKAVGGNGRAVIHTINARDRALGSVSGLIDLGEIVVGHGGTAIRYLGVHRFNRPTSAAQVSYINGDVGELYVEEDVDCARIEVSGTLNADINGSVIGGSDAMTGFILATGDADISIGGHLIGSSGAQSGRIQVGGVGYSDTEATLRCKIGSKLLASGDILGGAGAESGSIHVEGKLTDLKVSGSIFGGEGDYSGRLDAADITGIEIGQEARSGKVFGGMLIGGAGNHSGSVYSNSGLEMIHLRKDLIGGVAIRNLVGSGSIRAEGLISNALIDRDFLGSHTEVAEVSLNDCGVIRARMIGNVIIGRDWMGTAGRAWPAGAETSNTICADDSVISIKVAGNIVGGNAPRSMPLRIVAGNLLARVECNDMTRTKVLAGYDKYFRPVNGESTIGRVTVRGTMRDCDVVAGIDAVNGIFGDEGDTHIAPPGSVSLIQHVFMGRLPKGHHAITATTVDAVVIGSPTPVFNPAKKGSTVARIESAAIKLEGTRVFED